MMELVNGELTKFAIVLVAGVLIMVPLLGITLRRTVPPILEAHARARLIGAYGPGAVGDHDRIRPGGHRPVGRADAGVPVECAGPAPAPPRIR